MNIVTQVENLESVVVIPENSVSDTEIIVKVSDIKTNNVTDIETKVSIRIE